MSPRFVHDAEPSGNLSDVRLPAEPQPGDLLYAPGGPFEWVVAPDGSGSWVAVLLPPNDG